MTRLLFSFLAIFLLVSAGPAQAAKSAAKTNENITLSLPQGVISQAIDAVLPLEVDATSKTLQGTITIIGISDLKLTDQHLACRLHLAGNQLQFVTEVAGHEIRLKVGSVEVDFKTSARLRFDPTQQILYIRPVIDEVKKSKDATGGDIGQALVSLLNGKEFPISMKDLDPIIARTGTKTLTISTKIADVRASKQQLQFFLAPKVSAN